MVFVVVIGENFVVIFGGFVSVVVDFVGMF